MINDKDYINFLSCEKKYWLTNDLPDGFIMPKWEEYSLKWLNRLKDKVKERFQEHIEIDVSNLEKAAQDTEDAISKGETVIFNAVARHGDLFIVIDLLNKKADQWQVIGIKNTLSTNLFNFIKTGSSTKEVKEYMNQLAFQKYVLENNNLNLNNLTFCIMCLNYNYKREGELDLIKLVKVFNFDKFLPEFELDIESNIEKIKKIKEKPEKVVGAHCKSPFPCPFKDDCWKNIKEDSIHNIPRITQKKRELFISKGWNTIFDIDNLDENLTDIQKNVINKVKGGKVKKNPMRLMMFLNRLKYPIYHLDFETYFPNIPLYDNMRPMDAVPFQYSLHIENKGKELEHKSFLFDKEEDPRLEFIKSLIVNLGDSGSILVYNKNFESGIIKNLAESFPDYSKELLKLDERLVDLMVPFKDQDYWHPDMFFSYSLKYVLPALVPELTYDSLNIQNGEQVMLAYEELISMEEGEDKENFKKDFVEYCSQDTMAMVKILEVLRKK